MAMNLFWLTVLAMLSLGSSALSLAETIQNQALTNLEPPGTHFEFNEKLETALLGDTAVVASSWKNEVYVYQLDVSGEWTLQQTLTPSAHAGYVFGDKISLGSNAVAVELRNEESLLRQVSVYVRDNTGNWRESPAFDQPEGWWLNFHLNPSGAQLVVTARGGSSDANSEYEIQQRIYQIETTGNLSPEWQFNGRQRGTRMDLCMTDSMAIVGGKRYTRTEDGQWLRTDQLPEITLEFGDQIRYSDDCTQALVNRFNRTWEIYGYQQSIGWIQQSQNDGSVIDGDIDQQFVLVRTGFEENAISVFTMQGDDWTAQRQLHPASFESRFGASMALHNSTVLVSSLAPATVSAIDLSRYDFPIPNEADKPCSFARADSNGYSADAGTRCSLPDSELLPNDTQRQEFITVEREYSGPMPGGSMLRAQRWTLPDAFVLSGDFAVKPVKADGETRVAIHRRVDNSQWQLHQSISVNELITSHADSLFGSLPDYLEWSASANSTTLSINENTLIIGAPATSGLFSGAVFVFQLGADDQWIFSQLLSLPPRFIFGNFADDSMAYASALSLSGDTIAVRSSDIGGESGNKGTVHLYQRGADNRWTLESEVTDPRLFTPHSPFGRSMDLDGDTLILNIEVDGVNAVDIYQRNANQGWMPHQMLFAGDGSDFFQRVALHGDTAFIEHNGKVHFYQRQSDGLFQATTVLSGGELLIHNGSLWASDVPLQLAAGEDIDFYPVRLNKPALNSSDRNSSDSGTGGGSGSFGWSVFILLILTLQARQVGICCARLY